MILYPIHTLACRPSLVEHYQPQACSAAIIVTAKIKIASYPCLLNAFSFLSTFPWPALRDRGDLDDKVVSALVDHDKDYDTTEWEGYLKPMASASENVEKSHQRLLAKADVKNKKFNFAIPFFLDEVR